MLWKQINLSLACRSGRHTVYSCIIRNIFDHYATRTNNHIFPNCYFFFNAGTYTNKGIIANRNFSSVTCQPLCGKDAMRQRVVAAEAPVLPSANRSGRSAVRAANDKRRLWVKSGALSELVNRLHATEAQLKACSPAHNKSGKVTPSR